MINSLEIKNWRTHKETKLDFGKGTNVIIGVMGSGKSSIINALSYSLFGTFPALKSKQISLNEIIMNKPTDCEEAQTKINFKKNDKNYVITRIIKKNGTNEAKIYENEKLIAGPKQKDVNEMVEKILDLNYELFSRAAYSEQNEIDFFLKLTPGERKKKFDELLELEKYEIARKNSLMLKNQFIRDNKQKEEFIKQQQELLGTYKEEELLKKILEEENKIKHNLNQKENYKKKFVETQKKLEELEKKETLFNQMKEEITKNSSKLETFLETLSKKEKIDLNNIKKEKEENEKKIIKKNDEKEENEKIKKNFEKEEKEENEKIKIIYYRIKEIEKEEKELKQIEGKCPKCLRELTEEHKKQLIEKGEKLKEELIIDLKKFEEKQKNILKKIDNIKNMEKELEKELNLLREKKYFLERQEKESFEIKNYEKIILDLKKIIPTQKQELEKIDFNKQELEKYKKNYFEMKSILENIAEKIKNTEELIKSFKENIEKIKKIKQTIETSKQNYLKFEKASKKLGVFENCLIATQNELRETLLENINIAMTQIWSYLYPYKDFIDSRISIIESGYDLQVLTKKGNWIRVEGILSGGERSSAAICIRIAFALVLTKQLSIFILDEPTHNLDKNAIEKLSKMLKDSLPELVEQTFIITHEKEMEKAATSNLYLLQRNKDIDEPTKIELMPINE